MFRTKEKYCSLINGAFIILIGLNVIASSKLEFYGGRYQNLLIAIDPTFSGTNCEVLITEIKVFQCISSLSCYSCYTGFTHTSLCLWFRIQSLNFQLS
jgi:hypothetical protein